MSRRPHPRRAQTDPTSPRAWATSDRSGFVGNHENLRWQTDWAGRTIINKRILVYPDELDEPQRQLGVLIIPPDPPSILNARPEQYSIDEQRSRVTMDGTVRLQMDGQIRYQSNLQSTDA